MTYSVIIPVYAGEKTLDDLFKEIYDYFLSKSYQYEVIFVYDCGKDNSWNVLKNIKNKYPNIVKIVRLSRNYGQHNAIICGFEIANGDFMITMDEDLQHNPYDIDFLINKQKETDCDLVYGKFDFKKHSGFRNFTSNLAKKLLKIGLPELNQDYSPFRLVKSNIAKSTLEMRNSYTFVDGYFSWITTNIESCIVSHSERKAGKSSYTIPKLINHSINIFVTFSNLPIRFLTYLSLIVLLSTFSFSVITIIRKLVFNNILAGYTSLIIILGFGIGLIMLSLGIIGEYIYRINLKTTKRPNYKILEVY